MAHPVIFALEFIAAKSTAEYARIIGRASLFALVGTGLILSDPGWFSFRGSLAAAGQDRQAGAIGAVRASRGCTCCTLTTSRGSCSGYWSTVSLV